MKHEFVCVVYFLLHGYLVGVLFLMINLVKMKGHDKYLRTMEGMFRGNGGCGYVKKPDILLNVGPNGEVFDPTAPLPVKQTLKVSSFIIHSPFSSQYLSALK